MPFQPLLSESEVILSKKFPPGHPGWSVYMGQFFIPVTEPGFSYDHIEKTIVARRDLGKQARMTGLI